MAEPRASELAPLLRQVREACLERWLDRMRGTRWGHLPTEELIDHKADIYDELVYILERAEPDCEELYGLARAHAQHRHALGFELTELLQETMWFRTILREATTRESGARLTQERTLLDLALDETQIESSRVFLEKRDAKAQQLQAQAEEFRLQYEEALVAMTDAYFRLDEKFVCVFVNPAGERALGLRKEELVGRLLWDAIPGSKETEIGRLYQQAMRDQEPFETTTLFEL